MYDAFTTALLFLVLIPGVVITLPPGASTLTAALVHAVVFFAILVYFSSMIPWWGIWIAAAVVGGIVGSTLGSKKFDSMTMRRVLAVVLLFAGVKLIFV